LEENNDCAEGTGGASSWGEGNFEDRV